MYKKLSFLILLLTLSFYVQAQRVYDTIQPPKVTHAFIEREGGTLYLDQYEPTVKFYEKNPCMVFVFGGGFFTGSRDQSYYFPYYRFLMDHGYTVIAIDYRLGFKEAKIDEKMGLMDFVNLFEHVIGLAVEDLFAATNFILQHADAWNIDPAMIVASGSSAGAITVLQGEYAISSKQEIAKVLPAGFNYAGIVGFAGAIFSRNGNLKWNENTAPIQLFHGNIDKNVPYGKIKLFKIGFYGSENIAKRLKKYDLPYYFRTEENTDHRVAVTPMFDSREDILSFLDNYVVKKRKLQTELVVKHLDQPKKKKKVGMKDYINTNFGGE